MMKNSKISIIIGITLIVFSFYLLVKLLHMLDNTTDLTQYWPVFLIFIGVLSMSPKNPDTNAVSLSLIALGTFGGLYRVGFFKTPNGEAALAVLVGLFGLVILAMVASKPSKPSLDSDKSRR